MQSTVQSFPREMPPTEFGVRVFSLTAQQFKDAGLLLDKMMEDADICRTGCFVGRLENTAQPTIDDIKDNIRLVKETLLEDPVDPDTERPLFDPTLLLRGPMWPEINVFKIVRASDEESDKDYVRAMRECFKKEILNYDFLDRTEGNQTELERFYAASGVNGLLDKVFSIIRKPSGKVLYATNVTLNEGLRTTKDLTMRQMKSHIEHLPGEPCSGVTYPAYHIGQEMATFNPHVEDCSFQAVNRHIAGGPKIWFVVPPRFYSAFTSLLPMLGFTGMEKHCINLVNHDFIYLDPRTVVHHGIPVFTVVQQPGDILYLLPGTVHWGLNLAINITEGMNLASASWAKSGMMAESQCFCTSGPDTFEFDIVPILRAIQIDGATIENYKNNRLADIMDWSDPMNPDNGNRFTQTIKMEHLIGPSLKDAEVGKRYNVSTVMVEECEQGSESDSMSFPEDHDDKKLTKDVPPHILYTYRGVRCKLCGNLFKRSDAVDLLVKHTKEVHPEKATDTFIRALRQEKAFDKVIGNGLPYCTCEHCKTFGTARFHNGFPRRRGCKQRGTN